MTILLQEFSRVHPSRKPPARVVVYRDGIAHNMFQNEAQAEMVAIRSAFGGLGRTSGNYQPELVYIVAQARPATCA